jgi:hypothetical protein
MSVMQKPRSLQRPAPQGKSGSATGLTVPRGPREAVKVPRSEAIWFDAGHEESTRQGNFHQTPPD